MGHRKPFEGGFGKLFLEAMLICLVGTAFGMLIHRQLLWDVAIGKTLPRKGNQTEAGRIDEGLLAPLTLKEVRDLIPKGVVLVDARPSEVYREGHLPGAYSLPLDSPEPSLDRFRELVPLTTPIVVYCSGYGCPDSHEVGARLIIAGYGEVRVYEGGFPEWRNKGLPVGQGEAP